jgi:acyl-homoserine-lactone acylase
MSRHNLKYSAALALLLVSSHVEAADDASGSADTGEILWDTYGIPHVYGPDLLTVVRGYGYAQMENQAETILTNAATARGRSAEYFGPGADNANVQSDILVRTEDIPRRAKRWLRDGGAFQRNVIKAFVYGANEYVNRHRDRLDPTIQQVLPLVATDIPSIEQQTLEFTIMTEQDNVPALMAAWEQGGLAAANTLAHRLKSDGSNGWALAPQKSASGHAILMGNPHLPWGNNQPIPSLGVFQWMEVNLVTGNPASPTLNASGVAFPGSPFLNIAYSDNIGWTHTNNTIKNADLYELTLDANGRYWFGGAALPLQHRQDVIKIRQNSGAFTDQTIDIYSSIHGPIVDRKGDTALALRVAGLDAPSLVTQYWDMIRAQNLEDFAAALSELQLPFFNVIYADRQGQIMYAFNGLQPVRQTGSYAKYAGILPGDDPEALWTATMPWAALPRAINPPGGFVANSNNPPWTSTFPEVMDPARFPEYISPNFMAPRPQNAASALLSIPKLTTDQILAAKESTHMVLADEVLPDLLAAAQASSDATARQAALVLASWDRTGDAASKGGVLFERWYNTAIADPAMPQDDTISFYAPYPKFRIGWSADKPLTTPEGLANPTQAVSDLIVAAQAVQKAYGSLDVAWGDVHKTVLAGHDKTFMQVTPVSNDPESGPDDLFGPVRVVNPFPAQDGTQNLWSFGGDGYVQIVEFAPDGAHAQAVLGYGNASRPGSQHITDQLPFFNAKTLRPVWRTRQEVEQHTIAREQY